MKKVLFAYLATTAAAQAHGGHAEAALQGEAHWLTQPDHMVVIGAALCLLALGLAGWSRLHVQRG